MRTVKLMSWACGVGLSIAVGCAHATPSRARVVLVEPSGDDVPANLLRISIRFSEAIEGPVLSRISLWRIDGTRIAEPFLEQELWSPDCRTLTFLMHPGRVKNGLRAREIMGPILIAGEQVTLMFDQHPVKRWRVVPALESGPNPAKWKLSQVRADSRQPLMVTFDTPIDGQDSGYLGVVDAAGHRVRGSVHLSFGETSWAFTPASPWAAGVHRLRVRGTLEDAAGDRLGGRFETAVESPRAPATDAVIPFIAFAPHAATTRSPATRPDPLQDVGALHP